MNIENTIEEIQGKLMKIDDIIITNDGNVTDKDMGLDFYKIKRDYLVLETLKNEREFSSPLDDSLKVKLIHIENNIKMIEDYINFSNGENLNDTMNVLTMIQTIFLPLGLITGYFGMNFINMGVPIRKHPKEGIFTIKNPNIFILIVFLISSITIYFVMKKYSKIKIN